MATPKTRKTAPTRSRAASRKPNARRAVPPQDQVTRFFAADIANATLMGLREGYARAIAGTALTAELSVATAPSSDAALLPRFTKLDGNGRDLPADAQAWAQVRDNVSSLIWAAETLDGSHTWSAAKAAAAATRTAGRSDWRLPTIAELQTIVDFTRTAPAIDTQYFRAKSGWYWSSTPYAASPAGYAWFVYFGYGHSDSYVQNSTAFVRAVRSVVPAGQ